MGMKTEDLVTMAQKAGFSADWIGRMIEDDSAAMKRVVMNKAFADADPDSSLEFHLVICGRPH